MNRQEKIDEVEAIKDLLGGAQFVALTKYDGSTVSDMYELRNQLRDADSGYRVMKNTLAKRATSGTDMEGLHEHFSGPIGVAYTSTDPAAAAKVLVDFAKKHEPFEIRAGYLPGGKVLDAKAVEGLSKLPSRDELRSMLLSTLLGVPRGLVTVLAGVPRNFVGVLAARQRDLEDKGQG